MVMTKSTQVSTPAPRSHKEKYVAYGLRGPNALRTRCAEIAAQETRTVGYPVSVSAVMRKFIQRGCEEWSKRP